MWLSLSAYLSSVGVRRRRYGTAITNVSVVTQAPPGFSPTVVFSGATLSVVLIPWKVAGYLALSYLVFVTAVDASGGALAGTVGLLISSFRCFGYYELDTGRVRGVGVTPSTGGPVTSHTGSRRWCLSPRLDVVRVHRFDVTLVGRLQALVDRP